MSSKAEPANPARKIAFYAGLVFLFIRLGVVPEILFALTNTNTPILYIFGLPAIIGALLTGGLIRALRYRTGLLWLLFYGWMALAVPFSSWTGGSWGRVIDYGRFELPMLFVVGGLASTWSEVRAMFYVIACAAGFNLFTARLFGGMSNGRMNLTEMSGTLGNPNDLASQLLLVLPFVLYVIFERKNMAVRVALFSAIAYGMYLIFGTASRGGMVALAFAFLVFLLTANRSQRMTAVAGGAVLALTLPLFLPALTMNRLGTVFGENNLEAEESSADRSYLFQQSVRYTLQHPLFGIGPDQFPNFEGKESQRKGWHGIWHATHCTYTQVSSECGIPALLFFAGGIVSALLLVARLYKKAKQRAAHSIANACLCYLLGMSGFLMAIAFLSNAYTLHLPTMVGLAISISFAGARELDRSADRVEKSVPQFA
ncbi:MAG: O-antigen ligase family protein [Bryobacterales bacterium]|nr:O-antigen ligase family protein [Bryobacterales bacterium]